jgi:hypothetical protein
MIEKTFKFAGVAREPSNNGIPGEYRLRFANDPRRIKILQAWLLEDINLIELDEPMTKMQAVQHLLNTDFAGTNKDIEFCLQTAKSKRSLRIPTNRHMLSAPPADTKEFLKEIRSRAQTVSNIV